MRIIFLILVLLFPLISSAATVSGEISGKKATTTNITPQKTPAIKYYTGIRWGCYTLIKNKKTGKMIKKYVDKKFCAKK